MQRQRAGVTPSTTRGFLARADDHGLRLLVAAWAAIDRSTPSRRQPAVRPLPVADRVTERVERLPAIADTSGTRGSGIESQPSPRETSALDRSPRTLAHTTSLGRWGLDCRRGSTRPGEGGVGDDVVVASGHQEEVLVVHVAVHEYDGIRPPKVGLPQRRRSGRSHRAGVLR